MANATVNLALAKSGYVKKANPYTVYTTNTNTEYLISEDNGGNANILYFGFAEIPSNLRHNVLVKMGITFAARCGSASVPWIYVDSCGDFDPATLNFNNKPGENVYGFEVNITGTADNVLRNITQEDASSSLASHAYWFFQGKRCVSIKAYDKDSSISTDSIYAKTVLANGSTRPYVTITYNSATKIKSKISITGNTAPKNNTDPTVANTVTWDLVKDTSAVSGYCADETWAQRSGAFYYRIQGQSTWKSISVGSTKSVTIPANTLAAGVTYEYYIQVTDEDGTSSTYGTYTFSTKAPSLVVTYPAGNSRDSRAAMTWTWTLKVNNTEYPQASAKFYWRVSGATSWNQISVSGNTKTLTVPGYTFPAGKTIEWYLTATDTSGNVLSISTYTFGTAGTAIALQSYPSGSGVDSRNAASFAWRVYNSYGDFTQASAVFYWRVSSASTWNAVNVSGNTKTLSIAGYTFPAGASIQWYVSATDKDGTVLTSSTQSFSTAAVSLRMTANPSGSNIDPRNALSFSWSLYTASGDYTQTSAKLYWRVGTTGTWHEISISGNTKSYSVPASTFPTGSTIQWYLSSVGQTDTTHTTSTAFFSTAAPRITAVTYPSGNSVESGQALSFSWAFRSGQSGQSDYTQASAKLYWRASTSDPYQVITASGTTTSLTVPKNTFPGNASTVYWYLEGTDAGGYTSQTSVMSFRTVTSQITPQNSPTSGYKDPRSAITFSWYFKTPAASYDQASAVFHWRVSGESSWTDVAASGDTTSVTIPANTFPVASTIEWYLSGTDVGGCSSESQVYSFSTAASTTYAICQAPVGIVEDGTKPITFRWIVQNTDGTTPSRTLLWWKLPTESSSQWHQLLDTTEDVTSYTAVAKTFPAGAIEWRVQAYNRDSVAGPVNEASFVVLRAPEPPEGLSATSVPLSTISWQSDGQEAYEISIDGEIVAAEYGPSVYSWAVPEPLEDGVHNIRVRIQGSYGLWSTYAETSVNVQNTPTGSLTLAGSFGVDADLTVTATGLPAASPVQWYRDGKRIGRTSARQFRDRMVLGTHSYYAEIWLANGNYTRSNTVEGSMTVRSPMIADTEGGEWISLRLSENRERTQSFEWANTVALQHIAAADYPILEQSRFEDLTGSFDCAFKDPAEARRFEALRKKTVILKSPRGQVVVGGFSQYAKHATAFYDSYTFSIQQIHREDFVDDTDA